MHSGSSLGQAESRNKPDVEVEDDIMAVHNNRLKSVIAKKGWV